MNVFEISLENLRFQAYHGVGEQENIVGAEFEVSLHVHLPLSKELFPDDLNATISYADLYSVVEQEMGKRSSLIENVGDRICFSLKEKFPVLVAIDVTVRKLAPPISSFQGNASIRICRKY